MEDNTSLSDAEQGDERSVRIAELVISHDDAWDEAPKSRFVDECGTLRRYGVFLSTGDTASHPVSCNMWDCQRCAEKKALRELLIVDVLTGANGDAFFASVPVDLFVSARLSDRRHRLQKKTGDMVWYRWYERGDGIVWILFSHPLGGTKAPLELHPIGEPVRLAAAALRLPGVVQVRGSRIGDLLGDDDDHEDESERAAVAWIGTAGPTSWEALKVAAAREAGERFGVAVDPKFPVKLRGEFTPEQWAECLRAVRFSR